MIKFSLKTQVKNYAFFVQYESWLQLQTLNYWYICCYKCIVVLSSLFRVQPGYCFHLFTELQAQKLIDYQLPEMLRTPLEEIALQIKVTRLLHQKKSIRKWFQCFYALLETYSIVGRAQERESWRFAYFRQSARFIIVIS